MSKDGGLVKRWVLEGTDYVYPRTSNKIIRAFLKSKGVADEDIMENYTPFGFADWQTEVAATPLPSPPRAICAASDRIEQRRRKHVRRNRLLDL